MPDASRSSVEIEREAPRESAAASPTFPSLADAPAPAAPPVFDDAAPAEADTGSVDIAASTSHAVADAPDAAEPARASDEAAELPFGARLGASQREAGIAARTVLQQAGASAAARDAVHAPPPRASETPRPYASPEAKPAAAQPPVLAASAPTVAPEHASAQHVPERAASSAPMDTSVESLPALAASALSEAGRAAAPGVIETARGVTDSEDAVAPVTATEPAETARANDPPDSPAAPIERDATAANEPPTIAASSPLGEPATMGPVGAPRPAEERRARRPVRPPVTPLSDATFGEPGERESISAADPSQRAQSPLSPRSARDTAASELATGAHAGAPDPAAARGPSAERSLADWRRLLGEALDGWGQSARPRDPNPRPTRPASPRAAPVRPAPDAATPTAPSRAAAPPIADSGASAAPAATSPANEPILESTRRFLAPRVGIDPASVPIVRGPEVDRAADAAGADAMTIGDVVALPTAHDERSPQAIGLLAHELTHAAARREPRFVPPAVRREATGRAADAPAAPAPASTPRTPAASAYSEEDVARATERSIVAELERSVGHVHAGRGTPERRANAATTRDSAVRSPHAEAARAGDSALAPWGDLPAPWEPLPLPSSAARSELAPARTGSDAQPTAPSRNQARTTSAPRGADTPVQFAEHGRPVGDDAGEGDSASDAARAPAHAATASAPAPDLDVLARRVYDVLKRRLAAERRRMA